MGLFLVFALFLLSREISARTNLKEHLVSHTTVFGSRITRIPRRASVKSDIPLQNNEEWIISAKGEKFHVKLSRNKLLIPSTYKHFVFTDNGLEKVEQLHRRNSQDHCHYHGSVVGQPDSFVALSLCDGTVHGEIKTKSHSFFIEPAHLHFEEEHIKKVRNNCLEKFEDCMDHHAHLSEHSHISFRNPLWSLRAVPHITYTLQDMKSDHLEYSCPSHPNNDHNFHTHTGSADFFFSDLSSERDHILFSSHSSESFSRNFSGLSSSTKFIELVIVNDRARYLSKQSNVAAVQSHTELLVNIASSRYRSANLIPALQIVLTGQVTITSSSDPWGIDYCDSSNMEVDHQVLLNNFLSWAFDNSLRNLLSEQVVFDSVHLFTGFDLCSGTVGFAPIGTVCLEWYSGGINQITFADQQSANILAHEMGHNLNMLHDGSQNENSCPSSGYIMAAVGCLTCSNYATEFSGCSKEYYNKMMMFRSTAFSCLDNVPLYSYGDANCGDGFVEANEECDCGSNDCSSVDPCCDGSTCKLYPGADCSSSQACCANCKIVASSEEKVCRIKKHSICDVEEICDGIFADCPTDTYGAPDVGCIDDIGSSSGKCWRGRCISRKAQCKGVNTFTVDNCGTDCGTLKCTVGSGQCAPFRAYYGDGTPCPSGQCYAGSCRSKEDLSYQWSLYCENSCSGVLTREYRCQKYNGEYVADSNCVISVKPNAENVHPSLCGRFAPTLCSVNISLSTLPAGSGDFLYIIWNTTGQVDFVSILLFNTGLRYPLYIDLSSPDTGSFTYQLSNGLPSGSGNFVEVIASRGVEARSVEIFTISDMCNGMTCLNGGACENGVCSCVNGWQGSNCQISSCGIVDPTNSSRFLDCSTHGICSSSSGICECSAGYSGRFCQVPSSCSLSCPVNLADPDESCSSCQCFNPNQSGSSCSQCTLECGAEGSADSGCTKCNCNQDKFVWGSSCNAHYANVTLNLRNVDLEYLKANREDRKRFFALLTSEIAFLADVEESRVLVDESSISINSTASSVSVKFSLRSHDLLISTMETLLLKLIEAVRNPYSNAYRLYLLENTNADSGLVIEGYNLFQTADELSWYMKVFEWIKNNLMIVIPAALVIVIMIGMKIRSDRKDREMRKYAGMKDREGAAKIRRDQEHEMVNRRVSPPKRQASKVDLPHPAEKINSGRMPSHSSVKDAKVLGDRVSSPGNAKHKPKKNKNAVYFEKRGESELMEDFRMRPISFGVDSSISQYVDMASPDIYGNALPPGWTKQYFDDGTVFYFNSITNDVSVDPPRFK